MAPRSRPPWIAAPAAPFADAPSLYEVGENGTEPLWGPWIGGFVRATALWSRAWERVRQGLDREATASLAMIGAPHDIDLGRSSLDETAVPEMERIAPDMIPTFVQTLKTWSAWRGGAADSAAALDVSACEYSLCRAQVVDSSRR